MPSYLDYNGLSNYDENIKEYIEGKIPSISVDSALSDSSTNPVQNKVVNSALNGKVPTTRTINGKPLSANIILSASDVDADASGSADSALADAKEYIDEKIDAIMGEGASTTLDTIGEISKAIEEHEEVTDALNSAIGKKANASDLTSHTGNTTVHITSTERISWNDASKQKHEHTNKEILDIITSELIENWNKVSDKADSSEVEDLRNSIINNSNTIINRASGDSIHLTDSTDNKVVEFALHGKATQKQYSGKNLLKSTITANNVTNYGVTYTIKEDGSVTANGTPSTGYSYSELIVCNRANVEDSFNFTDEYIVSGCPNGGSDNSYRMALIFFNSNSAVVGTYVEYGTGKTFKVPAGAVTYTNRIDIMAGYTATNVIFKPMVRKASVTDSTYEPFVGCIPSPNPEYNQDIEVSGESYNLLENTATTKTLYGVNFTVNDDKSVTVEGTNTNTGNTWYTLNDNLLLKAGSYILGKNVTSNARLYITNISNVYAEEETFTLTEDKEITISIVVPPSVTVPKVTIYPMIRKASITNNRYMPYGDGSVEVKSLGKNILNPAWIPTQTVNGVTCTNNGDNTWTFSGAETNDSLSYGFSKSFTKENTPIQFKKAGYYHVSISGMNLNTSTDQYFYINLYYNGTQYNSAMTTSGTPTLHLTEEMLSYDDFRISSIGFYCTSARSFKAGTVGVQIEYGETATEFEVFKESHQNISTPNGLAGIKVSSGGNHVDANGQQWVTDEKRKYADGTGQKIQRIIDFVLDGSETWYASSVANVFYCSSNKFSQARLQTTPMLCNMYQSSVLGLSSMPDKSMAHRASDAGITPLIYIKDSSFANVGEVKTFFASNNAKCYCILAEPIITDLSAEEIAELEAVRTFYPTTNILNDSNCGMEIEYFVDSLDSEFVSDIYDKKHTHSNKSVLDGITSTLITNWNDANSKKHTHSNKTILDNTTASYTTTEQTKLSGIATGAEVNVQSDWNVTDTTSDAFIKNKPNVRTIRHCAVGQSSSTNTNPWYRFASCKITGGSTDASITFKVSTGYDFGNVNANKYTGILTAHVRTNGTKTYQYGNLTWEYAGEGIDTSKFVLAYKNTEDTCCEVELWTKIDVAWMFRFFEVLSEHGRASFSSPSWTLYNISSAGSSASVTSGYTQVESKLLQLKNSVDNASTATNLKLWRTTNPNTTLDKWCKIASITLDTAYEDYTAIIAVSETEVCGGTGIIAWNCATNSTAPSYGGTSIKFLAGTGNLFATQKSTFFSEYIINDASVTFNLWCQPLANYCTYSFSMLAEHCKHNLNKVCTRYDKSAYVTTLTGTKVAVTSQEWCGNATTATKWATARSINGMSVQGDANRTNYGTCSTAAATVEKVVACTGFALETGSEITVKFTVTNTASNPTLNVNGKGAKPIYYRGAAISAGYLAANRTYTFRYNGTQYELVGDLDTNTTYTHPTTSGNKHIPSGGSSGQILRWSADGTAVWGNDNNTTYSVASSSANGLMSSTDKAKLDAITASADSVSFTQSLTSGTKVGTITINGTDTDLYCQSGSSTDTKNTAGSTNTSSKIFLVGATSQATNPQTYSHDTVYAGTDGCLYSNNKKVTTTVYSTTEPTSNLDVNMIWIS